MTRFIIAMLDVVDSYKLFFELFCVIKWAIITKT